jgi:acyl dehydratase
MAPQTSIEDIHVGDKIPLLEKRPTTQQLVMYAGASGDFNPLHYDLEFAKAQGLSQVIVHGALKNAFLGQLVTDWIGAEGTLVELSVRYQEMDVPGDVLLCGGRVTEKRGDEGLVRCELWIDNGNGTRTTTGSALVRLPPRK